MTKPLQDDPSTQEPKIDNLYDAFYKVTDTIKNDSSLHGDLLQMIDAGVDLETITNVVTFGSFSKGLFSPLLQPPVTAATAQNHHMAYTN